MQAHIFFPGRSITDNILLVSEVLHCIKRRTRGRIGDVSLKLDISKAYDRVDWGFLQFMLCKMGFVEQWISWIMLCISTVEYFVLFNGTVVGSLYLGGVSVKVVLFRLTCLLNALKDFL